MEASNSTLENFATLRSRGVRIGIDDFGTGYSSLSHVTRLPVDFLKIDRSFIAEMFESPRAGAVVDAVVGMARAIEIDVVAEGVETLDQAGRLRDLGCSYAQGYLFHRPMTEEQMLELVGLP
jgi:EAL domain-containing protein (putative c-di-GMP-specific phosphodiesterase class I)